MSLDVLHRWSAVMYQTYQVVCVHMYLAVTFVCSNPYYHNCTQVLTFNIPNTHENVETGMCILVHEHFNIFIHISNITVRNLVQIFRHTSLFKRKGF